MSTVTGSAIAIAAITSWVSVAAAAAIRVPVATTTNCWAADQSER